MAFDVKQEETMRVANTAESKSKTNQILKLVMKGSRASVIYRGKPAPSVTPLMEEDLEDFIREDPWRSWRFRERWDLLGPRAKRSPSFPRVAQRYPSGLLPSTRIILGWRHYEIKESDLRQCKKRNDVRSI